MMQCAWCNRPIKLLEGDRFCTPRGIKPWLISDVYHQGCWQLIEAMKKRRTLMARAQSLYNGMIKEAGSVEIR